MVKLYNDYPSCADKAKRLFEEIKENIYKGNVGLVGKQDTDYRCCCKYEPGKFYFSVKYWYMNWL